MINMNVKEINQELAKVKMIRNGPYYYLQNEETSEYKTIKEVYVEINGEFLKVPDYIDYYGNVCELIKNNDGITMSLIEGIYDFIYSYNKKNMQKFIHKFIDNNDNEYYYPIYVEWEE